MNQIMAGLIVSALAGTGALAQQSINESRNVNSDVELSIENVSGSVNVDAWDENRVEVTGTLGKGVERLEFSGDDDRVLIRVVLPKRNGSRHAASDLQIRTPHSASVGVKVVSADIEVNHVKGDLELTSVSGDIDVSGAESDLELQTVSGDITVESNVKSVEAQTVSGDIQLEAVSGSAELQTVSGDISLTGQSIRELSGQVLSGKISFSGSISEDADVDLQCHSGNINVTLPEDVNAEFECETYSGGISNDFGVKAEKKNKFGPGYYLHFEQGSGSAEVDLKTFSGSIAIKKS